MIISDIGPGELDGFDPWIIAGVERGSVKNIVITTSGISLLGMVPTTTEDVIRIMNGGGRGGVYIRHMASAVNEYRFYCPSGIDVLMGPGATVELFCLNSGDHAYRFLSKAL